MSHGTAAVRFGRNALWMAKTSSAARPLTFHGSAKPDVDGDWVRSVWKSRCRGGRPRVDRRIQKLIRGMGNSNPTWGNPRIQALLRKIGMEVSDSAVWRYRPSRLSLPSPAWRSFLENHVRDRVAIDFFVVPTARFRVLYVFLVMSHDRRRIIHFSMTTSPSAQWTAQHVVEAFPFDTAPPGVRSRRDRQRSDGSTVRAYL